MLICSWDSGLPLLDARNGEGGRTRHSVGGLKGFRVTREIAPSLFRKRPPCDVLNTEKGKTPMLERKLNPDSETSARTSIPESESIPQTHDHAYSFRFCHGRHHDTHHVYGSVRRQAFHFTVQGMKRLERACENSTSAGVVTWTWCSSKSIRLVRRVSSTLPERQFPSTSRSGAQSSRPRSSSPCCEPAAIPTPKSRKTSNWRLYQLPHPQV